MGAQTYRGAVSFVFSTAFYCNCTTLVPVQDVPTTRSPWREGTPKREESPAVWDHGASERFS